MSIDSATDETPKGRETRPPTMLGPGFRFHPTDEELVRYYLRRKVSGKGFRIDAISEIDIYKTEPWDLPGFSKLKSRDLEWYFFSALDKKYGNGARTNRATNKGYWKTTGKDRAVHHRTQTVGMKKTLVYHIGRAPKGQRTNWVMHEYRLIDLELEKAGVAQDAFVLCRVFQKSGTGPKNGEKYGAPFVEEEWEDDKELEIFPDVEAAKEVIDFGDNNYLDVDDLEQILRAEVPVNTTNSPLNLQSSDSSCGEEVAEPIMSTQELLLEAGEQNYITEQLDGENLYHMQVPCDTDVNHVKCEYILGESSKSGDFDYLGYLLDEPVIDSSDSLQFADGELFLNDDDFFDTIKTATSFDAVDDYPLFFDCKDDTQQNVAYDSSAILGNETHISDQAFLPWKELDDGTTQGTLSNAHLADDNNNDTFSPFDKLDCAPYEPEFEYPFIKQASQMLGNIAAPQAFASEYPSKDTIRHLNSLTSPSSSAHFTAGMIQIRNLNPAVRGRDQPSLGKPWNINIVLSFGISQGNDGFGLNNLESSVSVLPGKSISLLSRSWLCFSIFWVLFISVSLKLGSCMLAK